MYSEIALDRQSPLICVWHKRSIVLGYRREYLLVTNVDDGEGSASSRPGLEGAGQTVREIFHLDGKMFPRVLLLPSSDELLLLYFFRISFDVSVSSATMDSGSLIRIQGLGFAMSTQWYYVSQGDVYSYSEGIKTVCCSFSTWRTGSQAQNAP